MANKCIGETRFFREKRTFDTLKILIKSQRFSSFEVWSSACATGEEAYSLAILLYEMGFEPNKAKVFATDVNETFLEKARKGVYSNEDIKKAERDDICKYFNKIDNKHYVILNEIKEYVQFSYFDLTNFSGYTKLRDRFNFVFLRNVLIYFHSELAKEVLNSVFSTLKENGCLFLGNKEILHASSGLKSFQKVIFNDTIYYVKLREENKPSKGSKREINLKKVSKEKLDLSKFLFYIDNGNIKEAYKFLQLIDKDSFEYFFAKGVMEELKGNEEEAKELYKKAIEIEPEFPLTHLYLGNIYYNRRDYLNTYKEYIFAIEGLKEMRSGKWKGFMREEEIKFMENFLKSRVGT